ncbi:nucleoside/nucleotide kinase family protein [Entomobacter blattae]|uniref:Pantothenate kinase n=1 Tax=Entomobacter blattae TaxID=2762277 RepID=A0A7H1NPQ3_9PROT|nr:nucleoside/nucleotide kinase family protein [Entomobacter blattae]QNT77763.1 Pantothenate kinase [Entomobacter blattae]
MVKRVASQKKYLSFQEGGSLVKQYAVTGTRCILGLCGVPGIGKSTLAAQLVHEIGEQAIVVSMDGFHLANTVLEALGRRQRKGAPDTFDVVGYIALLKRLRTPGRLPVYAPEFRREIEEAIAGALAITEDHKVIITEGNYLLGEGLWTGVLPLLDECWFLERDEQARKRQLLDRHMAFGKTQQEAAQWVEKVDEKNAEYIRKTKIRATRILTLD